jgi:uncharacterized membrane protein YtjA (UPF0391 family)
MIPMTRPAVATEFLGYAPRVGGCATADALVAYRNVFLVAVVLLIVILVIAQFLPGKEKALALQAERRAEMADMGQGPGAPAAPEPVMHEVGQNQH